MEKKWSIKFGGFPKIFRPLAMSNRHPQEATASRRIFSSALSILCNVPWMKKGWEPAEITPEPKKNFGPALFWAFELLGKSWKAILKGLFTWICLIFKTRNINLLGPALWQIGRSYMETLAWKAWRLLAWVYVWSRTKCIWPCLYVFVSAFCALTTLHCEHLCSSELQPLDRQMEWHVKDIYVRYML